MLSTSMRASASYSSAFLPKPIIWNAMSNRRTLYTSVKDVKKNISAQSEPIQRVVLTNKLLIPNFSTFEHLNEAINEAWVLGVKPEQTGIIISASEFQGIEKLKEAEKLINSKLFDSVMIVRGFASNAYDPCTEEAILDLCRIVRASPNTLGMPLNQYERTDSFKRQLEAKLELGAEIGFFQPQTEELLTNIHLKNNVSAAQEFFPTLVHGLLTRQSVYTMDNIDEPRVQMSNYGVYHDGYVGKMNPSAMLSYLKDISVDRPQDDIQTRLFMGQDDVVVKLITGTSYDRPVITPTLDTETED